MPRGKELSREEQAKIDAFHESGVSCRQIAIKMNRSPTVIANYVKQPQKYGIKKRSGRRSTITERQKRKIIRLAGVEHFTASEIKGNMHLQVTNRRIRQILHGSNHLQYEFRSPVVQLTRKHKEARLRFAHKYMLWDEEWDNVIFSDEKKFSLDGPDGSQKYWHDTRTKIETYVKRNMGGGSLMVWAAFSVNGTTPICFLSTRMDSIKYAELLDEVLLTYLDDKNMNNAIFQQDNAPIHVSKYMEKWFSDKNLEKLDWPAKSPDLNPIENLWGILSKSVYAHGRQFSSLAELRKSINTCWLNISPQIVRNLVNSMPGRLNKIILEKGNFIGY